MVDRGRVLVDTGYFFALFNERDRFHESAHEMEELLDSAPIILPWPILYEALNTRPVRRPGNLARFRAIVGSAETILLDDTPRHAIPGKVALGVAHATFGDNLAQSGRCSSFQHHQGCECADIGHVDFQRAGLSDDLPSKQCRVAELHLKPGGVSERPDLSMSRRAVANRRKTRRGKCRKTALLGETMHPPLSARSTSLAGFAKMQRNIASWCMNRIRILRRNLADDVRKTPRKAERKLTDRSRNSQSRSPALDVARDIHHSNRAEQPAMPGRAARD